MSSPIPERSGKSIDELSPEELRDFAKVRIAVADLLTTSVFDGLGMAMMIADVREINDPETRFKLLLSTTIALLEEDESRHNYTMHYLEHAHLFKNPAAHVAIYNDHFPKLINAAIYDAKWASLGAAALLQEHGRSAETAEVIPRSLGLLAIADVHGDHITDLISELGDPIASKHLRIITGNSELDEVVYTNEASAILKKYPSRLYGCPARALPDPRRDIEGPWQQSPATNLLEATWEEMTMYAFEKVQ
jgi:hypothetical protein